MSVAILPSLIIVLRPTIMDMVVFLAVDWITFFINQYVEGKIFLRFFPSARLYFFGISEDQLRALGQEDRVGLIQSMMKFPLRRAIYAYLASLVKIIPSLLVTVFYWHNSFPPMTRLELNVLLICLYFCYFFGAVYIESHQFLSQLIEKIHRQIDLSTAFVKVDSSYSKKEFSLYEILSMSFIIIFMIGLQLTVLLTHEYETTAELAAKVGAIGFGAAILLWRIWYLGRQFFVGGLEQIFGSFSKIEPGTTHPALALHTMPLLAQFEQTYNNLSRRLDLREKELRNRVIKEAEQSRYQTLGEMSALIAHDLTSPLHSIKFYLDEILENPLTPKRDLYLDHMNRNLHRGIELLESMRARLKSDSATDKSANVGSALENVLKLLAIQFYQYNFHTIDIQIQPECAMLDLKLSSVDLIHILDNLLRNSIHDLLFNATLEPQIKITFQSCVDGMAVIHLIDNGTGLHPDRFEELSSLDGNLIHEGLGLRLTRRLIDVNNGKMTALSKHLEKGSTIQIELPVTVAQKPRPEAQSC